MRKTNRLFSWGFVFIYLCGLVFVPGGKVQALSRQLAVQHPAIGVLAPDNNTYQDLPFNQDWTNTGLVTADDNWTSVPGIVGFLGDDPATTSAPRDPRTYTGDFVNVDVIANQTNPNTLTNGGVAEFHLTNPVVALQGSGTADVPHLTFYINTAKKENITVSYKVRDIDGSADNAIQPVALQFRVGESGSFTNVLEAYIADATTGPSLAISETLRTIVLPTAANNQPKVQVRVMTGNATGSDEWVGIDDISITGDPIPELTISKTAPASVIVNQTFTYTLSVDNSLGVDATGVVITDSLPLSVTFSAASDGGALLPGNVISWTVPTLANGASISQTVSVVAPGTPVTLTNADYGVWASNWLTRSAGSPVDTTVSALPTNPTGVGAADPSAVVIGYTQPVLTVAVTPGSNPPSTGLAVTCDLSAIGGSATQALFDDGTHGDATAADNTFSYLASVSSSTTSGAKNLPCTISDLETRTGSASIGLTAYLALPISKTALATVNVNQVLTYTLTVKNNLDVAATSLVITDSLPLSATFSSASDGGTLLGNIVRWDVPSLGSDTSITRTVWITAPAVETTLSNLDYGAWASNWLTRTLGSPVNTTVKDPSAITPIATARAAGVGWSGNLRGNVTVPPGRFSTTYYSFVIQDATGGIYVYAPTSKPVPPMALGDLVQINGTLKLYNLSMLEVDPLNTATWISSGTAPDPESIATSAVNSTQGKLVQITGTATITTTAPAPGSSDWSFRLNDVSGSVTVFVDKDTQIDMRGFANGDPISVIGYSGSYRYNPQVMPRYQSDIIDLRAPTVIATVPVSGTVGANPYYPVTATFNKAMNGATIDTASFTLSDPFGVAVSGVVGYNAATHKASFTPGAGLSPFTIYTATLTTAVKDIYDIPMAAPFSWVFTTGASDTTPPAITGRFPAPDATGVSLSANVVITFTEDLHPASLDQSHFILEGPYGVVPSALSYDSGTHVVTLDPNARLLPTTFYTVTVKGTTADWAGLTLGADDVWSFETSVEPPMLVYFGDLHNHTSNSDGSGTPAQALAAGESAGFSFMAITDHSYAIDDGEWADTLNAVNAATDSGFVALRGFEYTQGAEGHINVYNTVRHAVRTNTGCSYCDYTPNLEAGVTVQGFYPWLAISGTIGIDAAGTVMQFNHPGWINFNDWAYHPEVESVARLEEIGNGNGTSYMFSEDEFIRSLDYGWKVGATNNADTHSAYWGVNTDHRTGVLMPELTKTALLEALRERRTFASEDKNYALRMKANGAWMGSEIANSGLILFEIDGSDPDSSDLTSLVQLITDQGKVVAYTEPGTASFIWSPLINITTGVHYFYVKVTQADGERIVSSPVWTMGDDDIAITDIVIQPTVPTTHNPSLLTVRVTNRVTSSRTVTVTLDVNGSPINPSVLVTVPANGDAYANFSWQPTAIGEVTVTANLEGAPAGDNPDDNSASLVLNVTADYLPLILIDAGKGNTNALGREFRMFIDDLSAHRYNVLKNLDTLTAADLNPDVVKLLIITAPQYAYSSAEQSAIADFVASGGSLWLCGLSDYTGKVPWAATVADRMNPILAAIETKTGQQINMRMNDDEIIDGDDNNGYVFGVAWSDFPSAGTTSIGVNVERITSWSLNSLRGRLATEPLTASTSGIQIAVQGDLDTGYTVYSGYHDPNHTSNVDADGAGDAYLYNPTWVWPNDPPTPPTGAIPVPMAAVTQLPGPAGRIMLYGDSSDAFTSFAYTAGDGLQNELFNLESVMWLLGEPLTKSTIAEARAGGNNPDNLDRLVWVEGEITAAYGEFFNVLYVQDDTGGITVHAPAGDIDPSAFTRGTKVRVVGTVGIYNGDTEIEFFEAEMVQVLDPSTGEVLPLPFSTHDAALEANQGWLGVITGTVTTKTGSDTLIVNDSSGPVRVFLDGYNGNFDDIQVNDLVRATGLFSEDGDGGRIRVRYYKRLPNPAGYADDVVSWDALAVTGFDLLQSVAPPAWSTVSGSLGSGFTMPLDPAEDWYYLDVANLVASRDLKVDYHPFYVSSTPSGWLDYWAAKGVDAGATGWQAWMWQIINGNQPIFYLKVTETGGVQSYMLVDGLTKDALGGGDQYLRVDGTYLLGDYTFTGTISDKLGSSSPLPVDITFTGPLAVTGFDLLQSVAPPAWNAVSGSWANGYSLQLDPSVPYQYLNLENLLSNRPLKDGYYPFCVKTYPENWFAYWSGRGVVSGATGWQGWMWQIINGNQPIFYLRVTNNGSSFMLVDGLTRDYFSVDTYLRVDGTYLAGAYTFQGTVEDTLGASFELAVDIDFLARYYFPIVMLTTTP